MMGRELSILRDRVLLMKDYVSILLSQHCLYWSVFVAGGELLSDICDFAHLGD